MITFLCILVCNNNSNFHQVFILFSTISRKLNKCNFLLHSNFSRITFSFKKSYPFPLDSFLLKVFFSLYSGLTKVILPLLFCLKNFSPQSSCTTSQLSSSKIWDQMEERRRNERVKKSVNIPLQYFRPNIQSLSFFTAHTISLHKSSKKFYSNLSSSKKISFFLYNCFPQTF